ncbi:MAG: MATE family efflux transporter [Pseudomonadota bacterium]
MTDRSPIAPPNHRQVLNLAWPMILSNVSIPLLGMVDTAVVGHLPEAHHLGAVAVGATIFSFVFWGFGFLRMGTTGFVAQAYGKQDKIRVTVLLAQAGLLALVIAALIIAAQFFIREIAVGLIAPPPEVAAGARTYFAIRIWAAPATLLTYALVGWFLGCQDARSPLLVMLTANVVNIVFDLIFVVGMDLGVAGVAWASLLGEYLAVGLGLVLVARRRMLGLAWRERSRIFNRDELRALLRVNGDIMLRTLCLIFTFAFFTRQGAQQGEIVLAANAILLNLQSFMAYGLDGFAHAAEALVGRGIGVGRRKHIVEAIRLSGWWSLWFASAMALLYLLSGQWIVSLMTDIESVRAATARFLPWMILSPLVSVWSFWLDGIFIGATRGRDMRNTMLVSTFVAFLPAWWFLQGWGNHGLWAAFMVFFAVRGLLLGWLTPRIVRLGS